MSETSALTSCFLTSSAFFFPFSPAVQWEKDQSLIYTLKDQIETGEISPAEEKDFRNKIKEAKERISTASRRKIQKIRAFNEQAMKLVEGNPRAHKYWDVKKAEAEVEVIQNLYEISKKLPDKNLEDSLYSDYKKAYDSLKQKEKGIEKISDDIEKKEEKKPESGTSDILALIKMSLSEFKSEIKGYSPAQLKSVHRALIDRKNLALNDLRTLRRTKSKEMDQATSKEKSKIMSKYNPKIYDLGEFIDKIREKINHING